MITQRLLAAGKDVRILVRHHSPSEELARQGLATPAQSLIDAGAQPVYGDLKDRTSLDAACQGIETVVTTANSALRGGEDNVGTVDLKGNRNLIDAAKAAIVKHFVFTSAIIADRDSPVPFLQAKALSEEHLCASGMDYTILVPNTFIEVWTGMIVGLPLQIG
jgi:NADH dehydrogenase